MSEDFQTFALLCPDALTLEQKRAHPCFNQSPLSTQLVANTYFHILSRICFCERLRAGENIVKYCFTSFWRAWENASNKLFHFWNERDSSASCLRQPWLPSDLSEATVPCLPGPSPLWDPEMFTHPHSRVSNAQRVDGCCTHISYNFFLKDTMNGR